MCSRHSDGVRNDNDRARRAVRQALAAAGWNPADLARAAEVDEGTVLDFINGQRTPQIRTRGKLEAALGWPAGTLDDIAAGGEAPVPQEQPPARPGLSVVGATVEPEVNEDEVDNEVLAAIRRDPDLDDDARNHFLNQYELLREMSQRRRIAAEKGEPDLLPYVAHGKRREPVDLAEERRLEELAKQAAQDNPHSPYRDRDK